MGMKGKSHEVIIQSYKWCEEWTEVEIEFL